MFGLYRAAITEAEVEGRKPWPIKWLFGAGLVLAVGSWLIFILLDRGGREECYRPATIDRPAETYPCEKDFTTVQSPREPGNAAPGVGNPDPAGPDDVAPD